MRSMQRRLYIDFQQQPGASIGASGGGGEGSGGEEGASDDEGAAAAGSLLEGAALRTIVALVITGLKLPTQEEELAEQLQPTLTQLALHWWHDRWSPGQLPQQGPPSQASAWLDAGWAACSAQFAPPCMAERLACLPASFPTSTKPRFPPSHRLPGTRPARLQWIGSLTLLRRLTLGRSPQVPEQLTQLQALTHLGLHRCGDGREGHWSVPAGITALGQLRELQAWGTSLEGDMGALGCLPRLERLDLHESHVDSVGWLQVCRSSGSRCSGGCRRSQRRRCSGCGSFAAPHPRLARPARCAVLSSCSRPLGARRSRAPPPLFLCRA